MVHRWADVWESFRRDVARWVQPEQIVDPSVAGATNTIKLQIRHPPLRAMAWFRCAQCCRAYNVRGVSGFVQRRLLRLYGLELAPTTPEGGGLYIAHPVGCVPHARSIGENVTVGQVTFGTRSDAQWPVIGDRAFIGVGARVLGGITIGSDDARIGANAVVFIDVPAGATAVGMPARVRTADPAADHR